MRDIKRIKKILKLIENLWIESPDQRFGQLLINNSIIPDNMSSWRMEDDELEEYLKSLYNSQKSQSGSKTFDKKDNSTKELLASSSSSDTLISKKNIKNEKLK